MFFYDFISLSNRMDYPESTPEDLTALLSRFARNGIATSKVETGRKQRKDKSSKSNGES